MKSLAPSISVFILLFAGCVAASAQVLFNSSFDEAGATEEEPVAWVRWGEGFRRVTDWKPIHSGAGQLGYDHTAVSQGGNCGIWQDVVGVQAGKKYKISLYVMADKVGGANLPPTSLELRLEYADNGQQSLLESKMIPMITLPTDGTWQEISIEGTTPSDSLRFLMVMTPLDGENRGGKFKFDDVKVELMP
ncbi:MAG: carbohydrate binding domain-containing protein [Verrucomicrobia bacterium]|nr:carbohydrate binding domain-containing protein [Verrucomicrobiota bacterium]